MINKDKKFLKIFCEKVLTFCYKCIYCIVRLKRKGVKRMIKRTVVVRLKQEKDIVWVRLSRKLPKSVYSQLASLIQSEYEAKRVICNPRLAREQCCWLCEVDVDNGNITVVQKIEV